MNQRRKKTPFLRRALIGVLTLLMLVNVCFPAMQARATEENPENAAEFHSAIDKVVEAAKALNPETNAEEFKTAADAVSARIEDLKTKVAAIEAVPNEEKVGITVGNVENFNYSLSNAAQIVADKTAENAAYLENQASATSESSTPPSDNTSNVGDAPAENEVLTALNSRLDALSAASDALSIEDPDFETKSDTLMADLGTLMNDMGDAYEKGEITQENQTNLNNAIMSVYTVVGEKKKAAAGSGENVGYDVNPTIDIDNYNWVDVSVSQDDSTNTNVSSDNYYASTYVYDEDGDTIRRSGITASKQNGTIYISASEDTTPGIYYVSTYGKYFKVTVTDSSSGGSTASNPFSLTASISNAEVVYVAFNTQAEAEAAAASGNFTSIANGQTVTIDPFVSNGNYGYIVFFVKPADNYLLTGLGASGNNDLYNTSANNFGNIDAYPGIDALAKKAAELGYVGMFGYSRPSDYPGDYSGQFEVAGQSPDLIVTAQSSKTEDVKPGDELTFTVTLTPQHTSSGRDEITGLNIKSLTVNGRQVDYSDLVNNGDGTYTTTVTYTATAEDCGTGKVQLDVTADVTYQYQLNLSNSGQNIVTTSTIEKSATVECLIAPQSSVAYVVEYNIPEGVTITTYPDAIVSGKPSDSKTYYKGDTVNLVEAAKTYGTEKVVDTVNNGEWTFDGWYVNDKKVTSTTMGDSQVEFVGTWTFTKTMDDLLITKEFVGLDDSVVRPALTVNVLDGETVVKENVPLTLDTASGKYSATVNDLTIGKTYSIVESVADVSGWKLSKVTYNGTEAESGSVQIVDSALDNDADCDNVMAIVNTYERSTTKITLNKDVEGNMASYNDQFTFKVKINAGEAVVYTLKHGSDPVEIEVPIGAKVEITEVNFPGYTATATLDAHSVSLTGETDKTLTIDAVEDAGHAVVFTNTNDATIETGVTRTSFPFILLLSTTIVFAMILLLDKARYGKKF